MWSKNHSKRKMDSFEGRCLNLKKNVVFVTSGWFCIITSKWMFWVFLSRTKCLFVNCGNIGGRRGLAGPTSDDGCTNMQHHKWLICTNLRICYNSNVTVFSSLFLPIYEVCTNAKYFLNIFAKFLSDYNLIWWNTLFSNINSRFQDKQTS